MSGLHAVVFDFDGVVADSEPVHLECFQAVFKTVGIDLDADRYRQRYLGMDDRDAIAAISADASVQLASHRVAMLIDTKTKLVQRILRERAEALPGSVEIIRALRRGGTPLAVCSGALRPEILAAAERIGVPDAFDVIVSRRTWPRASPARKATGWRCGCSARRWGGDWTRPAVWRSRIPRSASPPPARPA